MLFSFLAWTLCMVNFFLLGDFQQRLKNRLVSNPIKWRTIEPSGTPTGATPATPTPLSIPREGVDASVRFRMKTQGRQRQLARKIDCSGTCDVNSDTCRTSSTLSALDADPKATAKLG